MGIWIEASGIVVSLRERAGQPLDLLANIYGAMRIQERHRPNPSQDRQIRHTTQGLRDRWLCLSSRPLKVGRLIAYGQMVTRCSIQVVSLQFSRGHANQAFDIFKRLVDGRTEWVEAVEGLEDARACLASLSSNSLAEVFHLLCRRSNGCRQFTGDDAFRSR